jgi:hypothetical protein
VLTITGAKAWAYQVEKGAEGNIHIQGCVHFVNARKWEQFKQLVPPGTHFEPKRERATWPQNVVYCTDPEKRYEFDENDFEEESDTTCQELREADMGPFLFGEGPSGGKGARSDLADVKKLIDSGASKETMWDEHFVPMLKYEKGFDSYIDCKRQPRDFQTTLTVYYGPPGSGKTRAVHQLCDGQSTFWISRPNSTTSPVWWDGYEGQDNVVIDEFFGWIRRDDMQRMVDRYPWQVPIKGRFQKFNSKRVYATSNIHPSYWWKKVGLGAMERRLKDPIGKIIYVGNDEYPTAESYEVVMAQYDN